MGMKCPACNGKGSISAPFSGEYECSWCMGDGELEKLPTAKPKTFGYDRDLCCKKAKELPRQCVCQVMTWCEEHGYKHIGTHD